VGFSSKEVGVSRRDHFKDAETGSENIEKAQPNCIVSIYTGIRAFFFEERTKKKDRRDVQQFVQRKGRPLERTLTVNPKRRTN
jgi:hypothetical protein